MAQVTLRTPADIGALIRDRRRSLGIDQAELAVRIGVGRLWVNQVERGKPGASLGLVLQALAAIDVEIKGIVIGDTGQISTGAPITGPDINDIIARARGKRRS